MLKKQLSVFLNLKSYILNQRRGFTLVELLIYSVIFAGVSLTLVYFLTTFFRVSGYQASSSEVANQANFILGKIQNEIAASSLVVVNDTGDDETDQTPLGEPRSNLVLKTQSETTALAGDMQSPVLIYKNGTNAALKRGSQAEIILNNASVAVTNLSFTKVSTPPGKDTILIGLSLRYQSPHVAEQISRDFTLGMSRAQAAAFDSNLNPNADTSYSIGTSNKRWSSIFLSGDAALDGRVTWNAANGGAASNNSVAFLKQGIISIDPPNITAGANGTFGVASSTVPGLAGIQTGDRVFMTPPTTLTDGLLFMGALTSADTITVRIKNVSAGAIDGVAQNWSYLVIR